MLNGSPIHKNSEYYEEEEVSQVLIGVKRDA
jgi:hypothetical protein